MEIGAGSTITVTGVVVDRYVDGGVEYVRIKGQGFEAGDQTALIPSAWVTPEHIVQPAVPQEPPAATEGESE